MIRFHAVAVYTPGKSLLIADVLIADSKQSDLKEEVEGYYIAGVEEHFPASSQKLKQITEATKANEELQSMLKCVRQGWPEHVKVVPVNL